MNSSIRLAVLIDAENISHALADRVFDLVATLGTASVRRIYGDFAGPAQSWAGAAARHALDARHCFAPAKGKNGADIALAVGAMDLLRDDVVDGLCIVSSDADFAALVQRIRGEGRLAFGIGRSATTSGYQKACTQFLVLDPPPAAVAPRAPAAFVASTPNAALPLIRSALAGCKVDPDGSYCMCEFGTVGRRVGIDPKLYGADTMGRLLTATEQFTVAGQRFRPIVLRAVGAGQ
jgi:hypothetical protein